MNTITLTQDMRIDVNGFKFEIVADEIVIADFNSLLEMRHALAGAEGEILGLRVTAGFFENRCEVLEKAVVAKLSIRDADSLKGCCPLCAIHWKEMLEIVAFNLEREFGDGPVVQRLKDWSK